jgi:hypothetical protein
VQRRTAKRRNLYTHLTAAVVIPGCIALCWWQVTRALSGNSLSWAYVFEWPIFGGYAIFMWWKLIHDDPPAREDPGRGADRPQSRATDSMGPPVSGPAPTGDSDPAAPKAAEEADEDEELASYNRYLAALHASGKRKQW